MENCNKNEKCCFPQCDCKTTISRVRAQISHKYRHGIRALLIQRLEEVATEHGLSKAAAAAAVGLVGSQYSRVIHSKGANVTVDALLLYLERLGVNVTLSFEDMAADQKSDQKNGIRGAGYGY